jgi:hypothetical protein
VDIGRLKSLSNREATSQQVPGIRREDDRASDFAQLYGWTTVVVAVGSQESALMSVADSAGGLSDVHVGCVLRDFVGPLAAIKPALRPLTHV